MARYNNDPRRGWRGKNGNDVFTSWKGLGVIKSMPSSYTDANTVVQQGNRGFTSLMSKALAKMLTAIQIGFKQEAVGMSEYNAAQKDNKDFRTGSGANITPDYAAIQVSSGNVPAPTAIDLSAGDPGGGIQVEVGDITNGVTALADDVLNMGFFSQTQGEGGSVVAIGTRAEAAIPIDVSLGEFFGGNLCDCYLFFTRADGSESSDTSHDTVTPTV